MEWEWIRKMEDQLLDELDGACNYIKCAISMKESENVVADTYYNMAQQELNHYNNIHTIMQHKIEKMKDQDNYSSMKILADYLDEKHHDKLAKIKSMMAMYKE